MKLHKVSAFIATVLVLSSILLGLVHFPQVVKAEDDNWFSGWSYRKSLITSTGLHIITVHYSCGNDVLGHTYLDGTCQTDFDDIRFTSSDGETLIDEVTVRMKVDGDYAEFKIVAAESPIYIYYGNLSVSGLYEDEVLISGSLGDTDELTENYVTSDEGQISGIARESPVTGFATSLEAEISSDVGGMAQMALLLMNDCLEQIDYDPVIYGRRIVALTETKNIPVSSKHREVFEFETPVPIFKGTVYGIALWAGAGIKVWRETGVGEESFFVDGGFSGDMVLHTGALGTYALGRFMNYEQVDVDEQNFLFRDNADYTQSCSMWHQHYERNGKIDAEAGQGIGDSYAFNSTVTAPSGQGWGELVFKGEVRDGSKRFWCGVVRLSALPGLGSHVELMSVLRYDPWTSLNGFGIDRTEAGVQWRLSVKSGTGVWSHTFLGEVEVNTDYLVILSYETDSVDAKSEVWVTKLSEPELLEETSPSATLTAANEAFGDLFFVGAADYPLGNVSATSAFFDEVTLTESFPATFGAWGNEETLKPEPVRAMVLSPENKTYSVDNIPLTFTVDEITSWMSFSLDRQANVTVTGNTTLMGLLDGSHSVVVYANDTAGNMGASTTVHFTVDTTPPNITDVSQTPTEDNVLSTDEVKVNATVRDDTSGVKEVILNYTNGNGTWITAGMTNLEGNIWNATIPSFPESTNVTYVIAAVDNANNTFTTEVFGYEYQHDVIPEFTSLIILPLIMTATSFVIVFRKKLFHAHAPTEAYTSPN